MWLGVTRGSIYNFSDLAICAPFFLRERLASLRWHSYTAQVRYRYGWWQLFPNVNADGKRREQPLNEVALPKTAYEDKVQRLLGLYKDKARTYSGLDSLLRAFKTGVVNIQDGPNRHGWRGAGTSMNTNLTTSSFHFGFWSFRRGGRRLPKFKILSSTPVLAASNQARLPEGFPYIVKVRKNRVPVALVMTSYTRGDDETFFPCRVSTLTLPSHTDTASQY